MARHLIASGRRAPAFLRTRRATDTRADLREQGYLDALGGREPRIFAVEPQEDLGGPDYGAAGLARIMECWPDTDAMICVSDALAVGALSEARRRGIEVPHRLAVTGFGDIDVAGEAALGLTTIRIDGAAIGREAARLTLAACDGEDIKGTRIDLGYELIRRATG